MFRKRLAQVREMMRAMLSANLTPAGIGWAVGLGLFVGALPLYGVHIGVCILISRFFRLNHALMYAAANISNPFFAPFLIALEIAIGDYLRHGTMNGVDTSVFGDSFLETLKNAPDLFYSCCYGSVVLGIAMGATMGPMAWAIARWRQRKTAAANPD